MKYLLAVFLLASFVAWASASHRVARMAGGTAALEGVFPWQVDLNITKGGVQSTCGGSLISNSWILTAGHCVSGVEPTGVTARMGSVNANAKLVIIIKWGPIIIIIIFGKYAPTTGVPNSYENDLALLKLKDPVATGDTIRPIPMATATTATTNLVVSGYGGTCPTCRRSSILMYGSVKETTSNICSKDLPKICTIPTNSTAPQAPCVGDDGGPLVQMGNGTTPSYLVGVVSSMSAESCAGKIASVYMRVSNKAYCTWMMQYVPELRLTC